VVLICIERRAGIAQSV